jgi:hypothetical protein
MPNKWDKSSVGELGHCQVRGFLRFISSACAHAPHAPHAPHGMMLYEAAQSMLARSAKWSWLKAWAMKIARHRGMKKAIVALARRLAVIMHRIWVDGTAFGWTREVAAV